MESTIRDLNDEMQELLVKELELNGVNFKKNAWLNSHDVIQEITFTLVPEVHEGKMNSYGVIFVETIEDMDGSEIISLPKGDLKLARKLANGDEWFVIYEKDQFVGLAEFKTTLSTEVHLIKHFPISGGLIIQRSAQGVSKFFQGDSLTIHDNRKWFTKPNVKAAAWKVSQCVANIDKIILNHILEFAFHVMSPTTRVGAILVWFLKPLSEEIKKNTAEYPELSALGLSIRNESHSKMLCHLLSQTDGATFLDPQGNLIKTGVQLRYSKKSSRLIPEFRGTRHTSSLRFSYDLEDAIIVTISEDGPVTVFSSGANIADLQIYSAHKMARQLRNELPEKSQKITSRSFEKRCEHCGKNSMVEEVQLEGYNEERKLHCPICRHEVYSSVCFSLQGRPYKVL